MTDAPLPPPPPPAPQPARGIPVDHAHQHPEAHEHSDVNVRALVISLLLIAAAAALVHIGLFFLAGLFSGQQAREPINQPRTAVSGDTPLPPPGVPRLQGVPGFHTPTPRQDMDALRARNQAILSGYGPSPEPGRVRIPIDRAMDLALERNLFPARAAPPAQPPATQGQNGDADAPQ